MWIPPPAVHLEESFQTFIVPEGSPNFSNDISDNAEKDREVCIAPTDAAPQVANYFPSTSVMDNVPPEVLTVVPVIDPIPPTSIFTIKDNTIPITYKARPVTQGFYQVHDIDYGETFIPVVRNESIRVLFGLAAQFNLILHQMNITTALLNGDLHEEIFMQPPPGSPAAGSKV
ncbi:hypothetical protein PMKS-002524 [Pichia membranifaciens]|uniref:Reverse transcriptase Ty1/copia-type domain-containing protein n=1 Tax=Pichia membranifaciens TaxID=4926 RepID=A0A1Q2YHQ3_9ASCO|nr:hypothetical protein PMKS-002524 [Pichia membranifaciens]